MSGLDQKVTDMTRSRDCQRQPLTLKFLIILLLLPAVEAYGQALPSTKKGVKSNAGDESGVIELSAAHMAAANRRRRIILQPDVGAGAFYNEELGPDRLQDAIDYHMSMLDEPGNQIDSVWWDWTEGNSAAWPSKVLPRQTALYPKWSDAGIDPVRVLLDQTRKRGREVFFSYRVNGNDNGPGEFKLVRPIKEKYEDWLIQAVYPFKHYWNFAVPEVRANKLRIIRELAELYDFDGIQLDFARMPIMFKAGEQWANRDMMTEFIRSVRLALLEREKKRKRPFLLAVRVPETIIGCHFDGYDVETWARQRLVDIFVLGNRSSDVDLAGFKRITAGTGIKLYPSWDDYHASDGYRNAPVEVFRGVFANWWSQGADGVHLFNIGGPSPEASAKVGRMKIEGFSEGYIKQTQAVWRRQSEIFSQVGAQETLKFKDKIFIIQRRGDNLGPPAWPTPAEWETPRHIYFCTNMLAPLPAALSNAAKVDTLLTLTIADDVSAAVEQISEIRLRIAISDPEAEGLPASRRLETVIVGNYTRSKPEPSSLNKPAAQGTEKKIECRINNLPLPPASVEDGWLVYRVNPRQLALGDNLIGLKLTAPEAGRNTQILIERVEMDVRYRRQESQRGK